MKIQEIMTTDVTSVAPDTSVVEAAKLMKAEDIGSVPVCEQSKVVGILTDRDIIIRSVAEGKNPQATKVSEIMSSKVETVTPDTDLDEVSNLMSDRQIRRVPVVENNKLVGIVALSDIALEDEFYMEASEALTDISKPTHNERK